MIFCYNGEWKTMAKGIRINETDQVPLHPNNGYWFLVTIIKNNKLHSESISLSKSGRQEVLEIAKKYKNKPDKCEIFHAWHGQYRTDLFLMDMPLLIERLEKDIDDERNSK